MSITPKHAYYTDNPEAIEYLSKFSPPLSESSPFENDLRKVIIRNYRILDQSKKLAEELQQVVNDIKNNEMKEQDLQVSLTNKAIEEQKKELDYQVSYLKKKVITYQEIQNPQVNNHPDLLNIIIIKLESASWLLKQAQNNRSISLQNWRNEDTWYYKIHSKVSQFLPSPLYSAPEKQPLPQIALHTYSKEIEELSE